MIGLGSVRTGIFNFADLFVLAGPRGPALQSRKEKLRPSPQA